MSSRPKAIYVLTSQGNDFFSAMTRVSVASLRITNPSMRIVVACDSATESSLYSSQDPLIGEIDSLYGFDTPPGSPNYRNRYIKTQLRRLVADPFLFLDSDTLIRGELIDIFTMDFDIAGCRNHSKSTLQEQIMDLDLETIGAMGWSIGEKVYINGGVLFFNDTPKAYDLADLWHKRWLESSEQRKYFRDQPALNTALFESDPDINILPDCYNAQFKMELSAAKNAILWHYYSSQDDEPITAFEIAVRDLLDNDNLNISKVTRMIKATHPWRCDLWLDNWLGNSVIRKGQLDIPDRLWFSGRRWESTRFRLGAILRSF